MSLSNCRNALTGRLVLALSEERLPESQIFVRGIKTLPFLFTLIRTFPPWWLYCLLLCKYDDCY